MRLSQKLVVAICGRSCTGKSTVAEIIAKKHALPVRHCGNVVQRVAADLNVGISDLADDCHRRIDAETVDWVREAKDWRIVEGRHLDHVLVPVASAVLMVHFYASAETRAARWQPKARRAYAVADLKRLDFDDDVFRHRLYKGSRVLRPAMTIDTTCSTPEEIANCLTRRIDATRNGQD